MAAWHLDRFARAVYLASLVAPGIETTRHLIGNGIADRR